MQPPAPQAVIIGLVAAQVLLYRRVRGLREWVDGLGLRTVMAVHLTRFVGIYFLVLYSRGELPYAFAVPDGWGDIITAAGAAVLMGLTADAATRRPLILAWNVWGVLDILMVVVTATRLFLADPSSMAALLRLPLSLLPTFLVPLIIANHILVFHRLSRARSAWR